MIENRQFGPSGMKMMSSLKRFDRALGQRSKTPRRFDPGLPEMMEAALQRTNFRSF